MVLKAPALSLIFAATGILLLSANPPAAASIAEPAIAATPAPATKLMKKQPFHQEGATEELTARR